MTTPVERSLIAAFFEARRAYAENVTPETRAAYLAAEDDATNDIMDNGSIETPTHEYWREWCHESRRFRLKWKQKDRAKALHGFDWRKAVSA